MTVDKKLFTETLRQFSINDATVVGMFPGMVPEVKFGYADAIAALGDVWPLATPYAFPVPGGQELEIVSTATDTETAFVDVIELDGSEGRRVVALSGSIGVPASIPGGPAKAVNRAFNSNGTLFAGVVDVRGTGAPNANVFARILPNDQQTVQTPYMVPAGKVALINNYSTAINKSGGADVSAILRLVVTRDGKVPRTQIRYGLQRSGVSNISSDLIIPIPVPPLAKIQVTADPTAVADISAEYSMRLIDANLLSDEVLAAIVEG